MCRFSAPLLRKPLDLNRRHTARARGRNRLPIRPVLHIARMENTGDIADTGKRSQRTPTGQPQTKHGNRQGKNSLTAGSQGEGHGEGAEDVGVNPRYVSDAKKLKEAQPVPMDRKTGLSRHQKQTRLSRHRWPRILQKHQAHALRAGQFLRGGGDSVAIKVDINAA